MRGVVENIYRQEGNYLASFEIHFSERPGTLFIISRLPENAHISDCILVTGTVGRAMNSGTLFINSGSVILCP